MNIRMRPTARHLQKKLPGPSLLEFLAHAKVVAQIDREIEATEYVMSVFRDQELCTFTPWIRGMYNCPPDGTSGVLITTTFEELYKQLFGL